MQIVRDSTRQFIDVNAATSAGYGPFLGCVSGPDLHVWSWRRNPNGAFVDWNTRVTCERE